MNAPAAGSLGRRIPAWAQVLGQTLRDALAFDRPGRFPQRDPFSAEVFGWGSARAPLPAVDPALAAAFPGRSPRELLGALERGRGGIYEALRDYARTAPRPGPAPAGVPRGPGSRLGAAGLWDCRRTRPTFYACLADGERLQRSPWGRLKVNPQQQAFRPIFRALLAAGTPAPAAMREAWRRVAVQRQRYGMRRTVNPGATWHEGWAAVAKGEARRAAPGTPGQLYQYGRADAHDLSAEVSRARGMNPGAVGSTRRKWWIIEARGRYLGKVFATEAAVRKAAGPYHTLEGNLISIFGPPPPGNPGAAWHETKERKATQDATRHSFWPAWRHFYEGKGSAHWESAAAAKALGMNPRRRRNPSLGLPIPRALAGMKVETRLIRSRGFDPDRAPAITSSRAAAEVAQKLTGSDRERVLALYLDTKNRLIGVQQVSVGARSSALVPPDAIMRTAILANAAGLIVVHNHPSGNAEPSTEDRAMTRRLRQAGELLDIKVLDGVIVANGRHTSLADRGEL